LIHSKIVRSSVILLLPLFTVAFGTKYLTDMVTSVHSYETFSLIKNNILHQSNYHQITNQGIVLLIERYTKIPVEQHIYETVCHMTNVT
jgi:hypothetical protein